MNPLAKSNVTLWKNSNYTSQNMPKNKKTMTQSLPAITNTRKRPAGEETKQVESEFIDNLKKQIYFMEMELKLMKEREHEIQKSGGFTQLFNDERDPTQHIMQLKSKYANMQKNMKNEIENLNDKKREVTGLNVSLKAKLDTLQKLERESYSKLKNYQDKSNLKINTLNANYLEKLNERTELEANNRTQNVQLKSELERNQELEYSITSTAKQDELKQQQFDSNMALLEEMTAQKIKSYEDINNKIKELDSKTTEEPYFKTELEKNEGYKKKIEELERTTLELNATVEGMELVNDFLIKKKNDVISERKKYVDLNVELRHEIEAKNQLNEIRIQKKVKEANSEEIQKLNEHLKDTNTKIDELVYKIEKEVEKIKNFTNDIIKYEIDLRHKEEKRSELIESVDTKMKEETDLKQEVEELNNKNEEIKMKIAKEKTDNDLVRNRNKLLAEEFAAVSSKYDFITNNYDYTTNLKKISMEELKNFTETNNLVNSTINNFVDKVGTFKKQNIQNMLDFD
jgi:chromosome segregation protein